MSVAKHGGNIYHNEISNDFSVNINPFGIPKGAIEASVSALQKAGTYPDPDCCKLSAALCNKLHDFNITPDMICFGNGATELINISCHVIRRLFPGPMLITAPTFSEYEKAAASADTVVEHYLLSKKSDFKLGSDFIRRIDGRISSVFLCNPNNPTGQLIDHNLLLEILKKCREYGTFLIVDECFINLSSPKNTLLDQINNYDNLVILRAFTKTYAMPSMRLGYMISSNTTFMEKLREYLPSWNINLIAQEAGYAALVETGYIPDSLDTITSERNWLTGELNKLSNIVNYVVPSDSNFILFCANRDLYTPLLNEGILIRDCSNFKNLSDFTYRISVKTHKDNALLIDALSRINQ